MSKFTRDQTPGWPSRGDTDVETSLRPASYTTSKSLFQERSEWVAAILAKATSRIQFGEVKNILAKAFHDHGWDITLRPAAETQTLDQALAEAKETELAMILAERMVNARRQNRGRCLSGKQSKLTRQVIAFIRGGDIKP